MVMSMTMLESQSLVRAGGDAATWHEVEKGFWVGNTPGRFLGTVEAGTAGYIARDHAGVRVGKYSDAAEARAALSERDDEPGN